MSDLDDMGLGERPDPVAEAKARGEAGMAAALSSNDEWKERARQAIIDVPSGTMGLFEVFRVRITPLVGEPTTPHAWGGLANGLKADGYLLNTGEFDHPAGKLSNGSQKSVMVRTDKR